MADFERQSRVSGESSDRAQSAVREPVSENQIAAYFSTIQRGGLTQPFGCLLAVEESTFRIVGYSENCFELLGLGSVAGFESESSRCLLWVDARRFFTPSSGALLAKAVASREISLLNPVWVCSKGTQKPFYAILHRIDVGILIDLEPARVGDPAVSLGGAVQLQKLAVRAISRLQALPGGDIGSLCDTLVEDVQKMTGYDRVMVYKFHEDNHGEVISEIRRLDLEPYLGLHFPATDIPQAARFLFKQNHVRIVCDCNAEPVKVIQSEELKQPLCLVSSTLRAPHKCHMQYMLNMGSVASLVMGVNIKGNNSSELWGLVVCHNTSPRYIAFPLRYACDFLLRAFSMQVQMELRLASQMVEKKILRTQTLMCDMLLRDVPLDIVTQSPSIIDLIKCDGAAMCYGERCCRLGVTPTESRVKELMEWLIANHGDSTGLSTDSLVNIGFPGAASLCDAVCGMATARITPNCMLFWFRSHSAKEVKWGGAKHHADDKDNDGRMYPRSSFEAFLEVATCRSSPWEVWEINAIHSLQLVLRDSIVDKELRNSKTLTCARHVDVEMQGMDEIGSAACEMVRLIETAIVPIFRVNSTGRINGWNHKIAELTGLAANEAMGKSFGNEVVHPDWRQAFETLLCRALNGEEDRNAEIKFRVSSQSRQTSDLYIRVNACSSRDRTNNVIGVCFIGQDITSEKTIMDKFIRLQGDYEAIIQSLSPSVPAIFASDGNACCIEWNPAMEKLTGWTRHEVIGRTLPGDIFGCLCRLKSPEDLTKFRILLYQAITEQDTEQSAFGFFDKKGIFVDVLLTLNKRKDENGKAFGCFCFLLAVSAETTQAPDNAAQVNDAMPSPSWKAMELAYVCQEMKTALNGIWFVHKLLETTAMSENQKQVLETSYACERQLTTIIDEVCLSSTAEGTDLNSDEFTLASLLDAIVSQVMIPLREKNLQMFLEIPEETTGLFLCSDQARLQLVLSDFLENIVRHASSPNGWVEIKVSPGRGQNLKHDRNEQMRLQFRMAHSGEGLPSALVQEMFEDSNHVTTPEGMGLNLSRKLLNKMNGHVHYVREHTKCYFVIDLEITKSCIV